jgi:hypothetical protein
VFRNVFSFFLLALFLSKLVYGLVWQIHYELNKADITARYCENKNRPELHCNGKCYLAKQLKKADSELQSKEQEQQQHIDLGAKIFTEEFYIQENISFATCIQTQTIEAKLIWKPANQYYFSYIPNCFHPPCIS